MSEPIVRALKAELTYAVMYGKFDRADAIRVQIDQYEPETADVTEPAEVVVSAAPEIATPAALETATPRKRAARTG